MIEPDEAVAILHTRIDGNQRVFICAETTSTEGYIVSVRRLYERPETLTEGKYMPEGLGFPGGASVSDTGQEASYWDVFLYPT